MQLFSKRGTYAMEWCLPSPKWIFIINAFLFLLHVSVAKTLEPIDWDKLIFQGYPTGMMINASIDDVVDIKCPKSNSRPDQQYHKFTQVTKQGYENCDLNMGTHKNLLDCNRPTLVNQLRLLFQLHTAYPGDPVFKHGHDYYFITTSDGTSSGIDNAQGGLCQTHNMKLIVHVNGDAVTDIPSSSTEGTPRPWVSTTTPPRTTVPSPTKSMTTTTVKPTRRKPTSNKTPSRSGENDSRTGDDGNRSASLAPSSTLLLLSSMVAFVRWLRW